MTQTVLLGDIAEINMGQSPKSEFYNTEGEGLPFMQGVRTFGRMYPVIDTWCVKPTKIANEGDLLFSVRAPVGDLNFAPARMCIGRGLASMKSRNNKFLYYLLEANKDRLISSQTGSVFGSVNATILKNFKVTVPESIEEQDEMANFLWTIDEKIELNRKMNETLEQMGQALFRHYFIDNPEAQKWPSRTVEEISDSVTRGFTAKYTEKSDIINLNQKVNKGFALDKQHFKYYEAATSVPSDKFAKRGDILINSLGQGTLGRVHHYIENTDNVVVDQHITIIRSSLHNYLYYRLAYYDNEKLQSLVSGTTGMLMLNVSKIRGFKLPDPTESKELIYRFDETADELNQQIYKNNQEIQTLTALRGALLPRLINGRVSVKE